MHILFGSSFVNLGFLYLTVISVFACGTRRHKEDSPAPEPAPFQTLTQRRGWSCQGSLPTGETVSLRYEHVYQLAKPGSETIDQSVTLDEAYYKETETNCQAGPSSGDPFVVTMDGAIVSCIYPVHTKDQVVFRFDPLANTLTAKLVGPQIKSPKAHQIPCQPSSNNTVNENQ
jgi:hypothetical protein